MEALLYFCSHFDKEKYFLTCFQTCLQIFPPPFFLGNLIRHRFPRYKSGKNYGKFELDIFFSFFYDFFDIVTNALSYLN
jgi:hypothetical protein